MVRIVVASVGRASHRSARHRTEPNLRAPQASGAASPCSSAATTLKVTSIIDNPDADPHDYEPTATDGRTIAGARLAIINGVGYDAWPTKLVDVQPGRQPGSPAGRRRGRRGRGGAMPAARGSERPGEQPDRPDGRCGIVTVQLTSGPIEATKCTQTSPAARSADRPRPATTSSSPRPKAPPLDGDKVIVGEQVHRVPGPAVVRGLASKLHPASPGRGGPPAGEGPLRTRVNHPVQHSQRQLGTTEAPTVA